MMSRELVSVRGLNDGKELNNEYFEWMCQLVYDERYIRRLSYQKLLNHLHNIDFQYSLPMDGNRAEDGIDLRYRFGYEKNTRVQ